MLVLSRKVGDTVRVGDAVVTIRGVRGRQVSLGFEAPGDVKVVRGELELFVEPEDADEQDAESAG